MSPAVALLPSYVSGTSEVSLLGEMTAARLKECAAGKLAHYKIPHYVLVVEEFPMTVTGMVRKVEMREKSAEILDLGEAAAIRNA